MPEKEDRSELLELVRDIRGGQRIAGIRGWFQIGLQAIGLIFTLLGAVLTLGSILIWLFIGVFLILLVLIIYQIKQESSIRPSLKEKERLLRILAIEKTMIENSNLHSASYLVGVYYEILKFICTTLHPKGSSTFDENLWNRMQIKGVHKKALPDPEN